MHLFHVLDSSASAANFLFLQLAQNLSETIFRKEFIVQHVVILNYEFNYPTMVQLYPLEIIDTYSCEKLLKQITEKILRSCSIAIYAAISGGNLILYSTWNYSVGAKKLFKNVFGAYFGHKFHLIQYELKFTPSLKLNNSFLC